ncbi:GGDEF domain-containing protein [Bacillus sp. RG28]|uniref:GGDEF domain-containing protein n=1 Tax=Gottfriedia endophytica TaxID=2820819 RepID=A0A940SKV1_9BACI|nr:GGDEF domain-containing protein [Gottfriedia endophytica]MBP0726394.1 GGDEF domain-containing protein [Gottfriedia endophytica]
MKINEKEILFEMKSEFFDFVSRQDDYKNFVQSYEDYAKVVCRLLMPTSVSVHHYINRVGYFEGIKIINSSIYSKELIRIDNEQHFPIQFIQSEKYIIYKSSLQKTIYLWSHDEEGLSLVELDFSGKEELMDQFSSEFLLNFHEVTFNFKNVSTRALRTIEQGKQYFELSKITSKLHSSFEIEYVLEEIISSLRTVYPNFNYQLLFTNQTIEPSHLPIAQFSPMDKDANPYIIKAYSENIITFEKTNNSTNMYIPIQGQQGVYGVLKVESDKAVEYLKWEEEFFNILATKAGTALENAKLYKQIEESAKRTQFVNEISQNLNQNLNILDVVNCLVDHFKETFQCEEIALILLHDNEPYEVLKGSTSYFFEEDAKLFIHHIIKSTIDHDGTLLKVNACSEEAFQSFPFNSILAVKIETKGLAGIVIMLHRDICKFTYQDRTLVQNVMEPTKLALRNTILQDRLEQLVATDHLTNLFSRAYLEEQILKSIQEDQKGTLILLDIDDFKKVNDQYGHQIGDDVLVQVSNIIKRVVRSTDVAARWGGEELAAYLPRIGVEDGKRVAIRIIEEVEKISKPKVTTSCGVSSWNKTDHKDASLNVLFKNADDALYEAKENGKNRVMVSF